MSDSRKSENQDRIPITFMLESIFGCKWSLAVLGAIREGVHRPGEIERHCQGISAKVLNERLRKLQRYSLIHRIVHPESPPRVEYHFTDFGGEFCSLLDRVAELQSRLDRASPESEDE
jgi:DNA-binding HxlR family transcriptional regulator